MDDNTTLNEDELDKIKAFAEKIGAFALDAASPDNDMLTLSDVAGVALALHWAADSVEANVMRLIAADMKKDG
jgi:hypothetical protein